MASSIPPSSRNSRPNRRLHVIEPEWPVEEVRRFSLPSAQTQPSRLRLILVWLVLVSGSFGLVLNLVRLQLFEAPELREKAQAQQMIHLRPFVPRRPIIDRNGNVLAIDQPAYTLYAHPRLFQESKSAIAEKLAPLLNRPADKVLRQLNEKSSGIQLEYAVPENVASQILDWQLDGLELIRHQQRLYPQQDLLADVVGYVNLDRKGQAGVEYSQQKLLERSVQAVRVKRTGSGALIPDQVPGGFLHVDDLRLQLTVDSRLQRASRYALQQQMKKFGAKRGTVIVMDARDGALLSFVSEPSYDPNQYYKFSVDRFKNWALTDQYEPGSTFKPLNVAIALEAGAIQPNSVFNDEGQIYVDSWPIANYDYETAGPRGPSSVAEILQRSSNVGMVHIVQQMPPTIYYSWLERIGLGQITGMDLPFESAGFLKPRSQFLGSPVEAATTAFGQGFSITPIQLVQLHGILASGGKMVTPHIVRGLYNTEDQAYWQPSLPPAEQIFSPQTARTVVAMMESVVSEGTGKAAQIPGYRIAGKTGTAQKANPNGGYYDYAKITSFVSIFPADAPRYVIAAVLDEPEGSDAFGSTVAAPAVKAVIEALITIEQIPPSQPVASQPWNTPVIPAQPWDMTAPTSNPTAPSPWTPTAPNPSVAPRSTP